MKVTPTALPGVVVVEPTIYRDVRGFFVETYQAERYREAGIAVSFVQDNSSQSARGTLRGLHLQHPTGQAKLVWATVGEVLDVAVDVRVGSPTFGRHVSVVLDAERMNQLFLPAGFAHGFCVKSDTAFFSYKCSDVHAPDHAISIAWNDVDIGIDWGVTDPTVSEKDASAPSLSEVMERLPRWTAP